jgi:hypothetical protein
MMDIDLSWLASIIPSSKDLFDFLNSNFTAALAGALAGALAAQRIGDRSKQRDTLLAEIRGTNAAIMVSFSICNVALSLKRQFVRDICETYFAKRRELEQFRSRRATGQQHPDIPFDCRVDLRTVQMPHMPIDVLRDQLYERISVNGRPLATVATLSGSVAALSETLEKRRELIERIRVLGTDDEAQVPAIYFGLPYAVGHTTTEFPDSIEALQRLTDDVIFFSELLSIDLIAHGEHLLAQYKKISRANKEKISKTDFTDARNKGLMPNPVDYADWLRGFPSASNKTVPKCVFNIKKFFLGRRLKNVDSAT